MIDDTLKSKIVHCIALNITAGFLPLSEMIIKIIDEPVEFNSEEYWIQRKQEVLKKFSENFVEKYMRFPTYRHVYEALIRDADPYEIIERLIEINEEQFKKLKELLELMPSHLIKK